MNPKNCPHQNGESLRTISQIAEITGISTRTLQYYDEIGLLKPSCLTPSGYRMYDDEALQTLQQILFFKELDFKLKDIKEILAKPDFDQIAAFQKQKELLLLKRRRMDRLIQLLDRLEKGEACMSFQEFDLSDYINALEDFKNNSTDEVIRHWGSVENYDLFIQKIKDEEDEVAKQAIRQFGSIEKYTAAMKYNLAHFSELMEQWQAQIPEELKIEDKFLLLAAHRDEDAASDSVQQLVGEIIASARENVSSALIGGEEHYCQTIMKLYANDYLKAINDAKYGAGSCDYIVTAFRYYLEQKHAQNH
ncbi:MAG: MerR family transcriptional regulator [Eubacterium sp.]|nr:MerR family transcriptional regulator [Eubacterium sp.]